MVTTIQKWGNSLAIRIPRAFAAQAKLAENCDVQISLEGDRIVVTPSRRTWKVDELVAKITARNAHRELEWGDAAGKEAW